MRTIQILVNDRTETYDECRKRVEAYLYSNFTLGNRYGYPEVVIVNGEDVAGWTAEAQVARLQSGLIAAEVVR